MKFKFLIAGFFFFCAVSAGYWAGRSSWNGVIYLTEGTFTSNGRTPAAIRKDLDFSRLDGAELITASQKRLVTAARVILQGEDVGVELGHFVTRGTQGERQLACDFYDHVTLKFVAEGIAENGVKPTMEIDSPCLTSNDITRIEPIWIPVQRILGERPSNMDISYPEQEGVNFKFDGMGTQWPTRWNLQSVRLYTTGHEFNREVKISGREIREIISRPIVVNWQSEDYRTPAAQ